jgi:hypothetical protein
MGINGFQPFLIKTYKKACKQYFNVQYDNLYIDLNHVLHHVCYKSKNTSELIELCKNYLLGIIKSVKPKSRVILAADGAAPLAKMILQRKRRLDSIKSLEGDIDLTKNLNLNLTPGTEFMMKLEHSLEGFINYIKEKFSVDVITLITDADEGEIKIKHELLKIQKRNPDETHIVYSADSDVVLILFTCTDLTKIYHMIKHDLIIHYGTMYDEHVALYGSSDSLKNDFVFINLMMGNDYLPKVLYFKLENIWEAYKIVSGYLPKGMISSDANSQTNIIIDPLFIHDLLYIASKNISKGLLNKFQITDLKNCRYTNYINGIYWCYGMYALGKCSNYKYIYEQLDTNPHITGVMFSLMYHNKYIIHSSPSIDIDLYGILLIPEKACKLLSKEQNLIVSELISEHPIIYEEGRCEKCKKYSREASAINKEAKTYDDESYQKTLILKKIRTINKKFALHRASHKKMTINVIDKISKTFINIREKLRETMSLESDTSADDKSIEVYKPMPNPNSICIKKRLF